MAMRILQGERVKVCVRAPKSRSVSKCEVVRASYNEDSVDFALDIARSVPAGSRVVVTVGSLSETYRTSKDVYGPGVTRVYPRKSRR